MKLQFWGCRGSVCFSTSPRPAFCCPERGHCAPGAVPAPAARAGRAGLGAGARHPRLVRALPRLRSGQRAAQPRTHPSAPADLRGERGFAFPVEGKMLKNALFHPHPPWAMRWRIKPTESRRAARGLRGGRGVHRGMRSPPRPPVNSGAKPGPGAAGSIGALMVQ